MFLKPLFLPPKFFFLWPICKRFLHWPFSSVVYTGKDVLKKIKEDATGEFRTTLMNLIEVTAVMPSDCDWTRMYNISQNARDQLLISNRLGNI